MDQVLAHVSSRVLVDEHGTVRRDSHGISFTALLVNVAHAYWTRPRPAFLFARLVVVPSREASGVDDGLAVRAHQRIGLPAPPFCRSTRLAGVVPVRRPRLAAVGGVDELHHGLRLLARTRLGRRVRAW